MRLLVQTITKNVFRFIKSYSLLRAEGSKDMRSKTKSAYILLYYRLLILIYLLKSGFVFNFICSRISGDLIAFLKLSLLSWKNTLRLWSKFYSVYRKDQGKGAGGRYNHHPYNHHRWSSRDENAIILIAIPARLITKVKIWGKKVLPTGVKRGVLISFKKALFCLKPHINVSMQLAY